MHCKYRCFNINFIIYMTGAAVDGLVLTVARAYLARAAVRISNNI